MAEHIKTWRERLAGLDKPTDFAEAQAAKHEAADLRRYIAELERASQPGSGEEEDAARWRYCLDIVHEASEGDWGDRFVVSLPRDEQHRNYRSTEAAFIAAIDAARASLDGRREG